MSSRRGPRHRTPERLAQVEPEAGGSLVAVTQPTEHTQRFDFTWDPAYRRAARVFRVTPRTAWVDVDDEMVDAHFGPFRLRVPRSNLTGVAVTGPYRFVKTAGPARLGITDAGLTFATNGERGVLLSFHEKVRASGPTRFLRHPELTVTVADVDGLAAALRG